MKSILGYQKAVQGAVRETALSEELFNWRLALEQKRADRSGEAFALVRVGLEGIRGDDPEFQAIARDLVFSCLRNTFRETDLVGWQCTDEAMGVILTELGDCPWDTAADSVMARLHDALERHLPQDFVHKISVRTNYFSGAARRTSATNARRPSQHERHREAAVV